MFAHVFCLFVLFAGSLANREDIIIDSAFNYLLVVDDDIRQSADASTLVVSIAHRCVRTFDLTVEVDADALVTVERISGVLDNGDHSWSKHGEAVISSGIELAIPMTGKACASTWRFVVQGKNVSWKQLSVDGFAALDTTKRQSTTCFYDPTALYPPECSSASSGALCVTAGTCGCKVDRDCFGNTDFPYCLIAAGAAEGECDRCTALSSSATDYDDHYFCRTRYPGYATQPTDGSTLPNERAAPLNYFREYCVRTPVASSGACQRCNQAPLVTTLNASWTLAQRQGASGTIFCNTIRPTTAPICMDQTYMQDTSGGANYDVNLRGACVPCEVNDECARALPLTPLCDFASGGKSCVRCSTNVQCGNMTTLDLPNCQADGSCIYCEDDTDCGILDGGEKAAQARCDTATGICVDAFSCLGNIGEGTAADCSAANGGSNCNKNGACITCTTNAQCGNTDGGTTQNQQVCNNGVCTECDVNSDCVGTSGANCQADGSCLDCTSLTCGVLDGGQGGACTAAYCPDVSGQTICNAGNKLCESPCPSNAWCSAKKTAQGTLTTNNGANCGINGICANCQTPGSASVIANSANCGTVDGPLATVPGFSGKAGQTSCDTTGICIDPFNCAVNADCSGAPAAPYTCTDTTTSCANCQTNGACQPCLVDYTSSTCGSTDGGEVSGQINCRTASRQCVAACATNADCTGTQGANCMANGLCLDCRTDADCKTGNAWNGDMGSQTVCQNTICIDACASNNVCAATSNCMKDGRCTPCTSDSDCVTNDGPPPMGTDTVCKSGRCQPPFTCSGASGTPADNNDCKTFGAGNNCFADGSCKTCTKDSDCIGDGGFTPNQPKCDVASGTCVACGSNADCLGTGSTKNCDNDGLCRDCRTQYSATQSCETMDGPPGLGSNQNCDSLTGICVDFCTTDAHCTDACAPHCNIERGCCVECLGDNHCPVDQWRGSQTSYTKCSSDFMCVLPGGDHVCETDADCSGALPACDFGRQVCVQCMADTHCSRTTAPACKIGTRTCVDCTDDSYCVNDLDEDGNSKVCGSDNVCEDEGSFVTFSLVLCLVLALIRLF